MMFSNPKLAQSIGLALFPIETSVSILYGAVEIQLFLPGRLLNCQLMSRSGLGKNGTDKLPYRASPSLQRRPGNFGGPKGKKKSEDGQHAGSSQVGAKRAREER
jgi:hypothetical protein